MRANEKPFYGPVSFQSYLRANHLSNKDTARYISVQSLDGLAPELRAANTMVFRLGCGEGERGTNFALVRCVLGWDDYFFIDEVIFGASPIERHSVSENLAYLRVFQYLPRYTETTLVNLALASGVLSRALNLDPSSVPFPATGQGTYTFAVTANQSIPVTWAHNNGQVEIDAVFVASRGGSDTVFVVESKASAKYGSLSKHKLAYPLLALRTTIPPELPIVGVYLRALKHEYGFRFSIAECQFDEGSTAIASLSSVSRGVYELYGFDCA